MTCEYSLNPMIIKCQCGVRLSLVRRIAVDTDGVLKEFIETSPCRNCRDEAFKVGEGLGRMLELKRELTRVEHQTKHVQHYIEAINRKYQIESGNYVEPIIKNDRLSKDKT